MPNTEAQWKEGDKQPPPGYPTATTTEVPERMSCSPRSKKKGVKAGERGLVAACLCTAIQCCVCDFLSEARSALCRFIFCWFCDYCCCCSTLECAQCCCGC
ncbi:hypothetical protein AQUCO_01400657v1 [Aquilegia coerulea]|uniref:Uncharacterized protein n=1 Tax=Aquilegia coerulea TaxID=218851 RepID=A0A2G5DXJ5_AQUCA|nr:hypothetical protein AQUCO_01400657v1 [Aquilegia coerulea]